MDKDQERKPIPKWVRFCFWIGVALFVSAGLFLLCNQLWILSHEQKWSGEVDAAIINTFIGAITLAVTIGVTVYFNLQTQRITIEQNQKNLELQMELHKQNLEMQERINQQNMELQQKMQEMNYEAMMFQARAGIRDELLRQRIPIYTKLFIKMVKLIEYYQDLYDEFKSYYIYDPGIPQKNKLSTIHKLTTLYDELRDLENDNYLVLSVPLKKLLLSIYSNSKLELFRKLIEGKLEQRFHFDDAFATLEKLMEITGEVQSQIERELQLDEIEEDISSL